MKMLLYFLTRLLSYFVFPIGFIYGIIRDFNSNQDKFLKMATSLDMFANVICPELFGDLFLMRTSKNFFGNPKQTISEVIAINNQMLTLSKLGNWLGIYLNYVDPYHLQKALRMEVPKITLTFMQKIIRILTIFLMFLILIMLLFVFYCSLYLLVF